MAKSKTKITHLRTRWSQTVDKNCPLPEYPRPQLKRDEWSCLNGLWEYAICDGTEKAEPEKYDGNILVPYSPESLLSGVERQLLPSQTLWYRKEISLNPPEQEKRLLLHFGAVDQYAEVFINGQVVGKHEGGYWPFSFDITDLICSGNNVVTVAVRDYSDSGIEAYGKQKLERGGIWYTAQSGIWQTVWTEAVPKQHIEHIKITPHCESAEVEFSIRFSLPNPPPVRVRVFDGEHQVSEGCFESCTFRLSVPDFHYWSPENPFLYTVKIEAGADEIESYFGMREFGITKDQNGHPRLTLNGEILFHSGLLDQGYWSDGMYTPPSDEAMIWDIVESKKLGFNVLRKHIKIEPMRWYYHCDRLGMLVWQDFVSGGSPYGEFMTRYLPFIGLHMSDKKQRPGLGRSNLESCAVFERDMIRTIDLLYNVVSLAVWVPFNEGWGQFDAKRICEELIAIDNTRAIDHASGWHDQGVGDFMSHHVYYKPFRMKADKRGRIQALTEFGGYSCPSHGHMATNRLFGYRMYKDKDDFNKAIETLFSKEIIPKVAQGLAATIYTQITDIEDEINGLFTYDRAELKIDPELMQRINKELMVRDMSNEDSK